MATSGREWGRAFGLAAGVLAILALGSFAAQAAESDEELRAKVDILAGEVASLREQLAIPATDAELSSAYGLGPGASKVYGVSEGVSLGGYGEFYFASPLEETDETGAVNVCDRVRVVKSG